MRILRLTVLVLFSTAAAGAQSSLAQRIEDLRHETSVRLALAENVEMHGYNVTVEAAEGVVVLSGLVPTLGARDRAVAYVNSLPKVRVVRSTLRLEGKPNEPLPDLVMAQPQQMVSGAEPPEDVEIPEPQPEETGPIFHTVRRGDTLYGIARRYETTVGVITELNTLRSTTVRVGQRLQVK